MVERTVDGLRAAGVAGINFDLIYGLPHQTVQTLLETIAHCERMRPDRIALFGYAHVPWMAKNQRMIPEDALPDAGARAAQASAAAAALVAAGYEAIGLDHFALPDDDLAIAARKGALHRNFQGYTTDTATTLIGLGATSISQTPKGYVQNIAETGAWARAVADGRLPVARGVAFSHEDRLRGRVIERIMCAGSVDLDAMGGPPGWWEAERATLDAMAADGIVTLDGSHLSLTPAGRGLCRVVAAVFDTYLGRAEARHSVAV
jgi:oxygen-independent coproporphyrinogen-3 oxidase